MGVTLKNKAYQIVDLAFRMNADCTVRDSKPYGPMAVKLYARNAALAYLVGSDFPASEHLPFLSMVDFLSDQLIADSVIGQTVKP